jgi:hypothetical protein
MEAASKSPPTPTPSGHESPSLQNVDRQESFDSLDIAMQQLEEIVQADTKGNETNKQPNDQPASQHTASPPTQEETDKNAIHSLGRDLQSQL